MYQPFNEFTFNILLKSCSVNHFWEHARHTKNQCAFTVLSLIISLIDKPALPFHNTTLQCRLGIWRGISCVNHTLVWSRVRSAMMYYYCSSNMFRIQRHLSPAIQRVLVTVCLASPVSSSAHGMGKGLWRDRHTQQKHLRTLLHDSTTVQNSRCMHTPQCWAGELAQLLLQAT